jgi:ankyrin repeat protein
LISAPELSKHLTTSHSPFHDAPNNDVVKCLLSSGADINLLDEDGHSPLFAASDQ